jgi:hypothetical protein
MSRTQLCLAIPYILLQSIMNRDLRKKHEYNPAEMILFPERNYGSTILVSIFREGKMLIKYNGKSSILIG